MRAVYCFCATCFVHGKLEEGQCGIEFSSRRVVGGKAGFPFVTFACRKSGSLEETKLQRDGRFWSNLANSRNQLLFEPPKVEI